jgi:hypothetical protein
MNQNSIRKDLCGNCPVGMRSCVDPAEWVLCGPVLFTAEPLKEACQVRIFGIEFLGEDLNF